MTDVRITQDEASDLKRKLKENKSPGADNTYPHVLNKCSTELSKPLCMICNQSLIEATLPQDWKDANITSLHKKVQHLMLATTVQ